MGTLTLSLDKLHLRNQVSRDQAAEIFRSYRVTVRQNDNTGGQSTDDIHQTVSIHF
jgi:hypothetical protein